MAKLTMRDRDFQKVKCTTQFIVGASDEPDSEIIESMNSAPPAGGLNFSVSIFRLSERLAGHPDIPE